MPQLELTFVNQTEGAVVKTDSKAVSARAEPEQAEAFSCVRPGMLQTCLRLASL